MRAIPDAAVDLVARWEGLELEAYPDPATGGDPWTIGYGHTQGVRPGQTITKSEAKAFLKVDLQDAARKLQAKIGGVVDDLTENQYAALLSFVFNVGTGNPKKTEWTIWKRLRSRQFDQIPGELIKFVNAAGKKMQGLVNRRTDEIRVWSTDEPGSDDIRMTSAHTRDISTPPTPVDPTPPQKSATVWAAITAPFAGIWLAIQSWGAMLIEWMGSAPDFLRQAISAVDPFKDKSPIAEALQTGLATAAAALGVFLAWSTWKKKRENRR